MKADKISLSRIWSNGRVYAKDVDYNVAGISVGMNKINEQFPRHTSCVAAPYPSGRIIEKGVMGDQKVKTDS